MYVIVTARNEAERIGATLDALVATFPDARVIVADDSSTDTTAAIARARGVQVISPRPGLGKGGAATAAVAVALGEPEISEDSIVLLCDGDLGGSAAQLDELVQAVVADQADLTIAAFARKQGGGFGFAVGYARRAIRRQTGVELDAPISGQRAMRAQVLRAVLPFAAGFGMEIGMTIDAARADYRIVEVELDLEHASTGRNLRGFLHRGRQLRDFRRAVRDRK